MRLKMKKPLQVYMIWHPSFLEGDAYAQQFYSLLNREVQEPLARGIGIPVYFRNRTDLFFPIHTTDSCFTAIVLFIDDYLINDPSWESHMIQIEKLNEQKNCIVYPIAVTEHAFNISKKLPEKNFVRLFNYKNEQKELYLKSTIVHELCRLLFDKKRISDEKNTVEKQGTFSKKSSPALKMFISHAKEDGAEVAEKINSYIQNNMSLKTFFDANDIPIGYDFSEEIEENIEKSILLVIHSDKYSSREWCRREIILAKKNNRPILIANLFEKGEERSFPYMANLKTIRVQEVKDEKEKFQVIIYEALKEALRFKYHQLNVEYLVKNHPLDIGEQFIFSYPPELLSLNFLKGAETPFCIYPDPPLTKEELDLIGTMNEEVQFITPTFLSLIDEEKKIKLKTIEFLNEKKISISISESEDIEEFGLTNLHLQDCMVEFSRYLLVSGATLAYGGNLNYFKDFNFTEILFNLARHHFNTNKENFNKIINYVSYPLSSAIKIDQKSSIKNIVNLVEVKKEVQYPFSDKEVLSYQTHQHQQIWKENLTSMRKKMSSDTDAAILIGGKMNNYKGSMPGILEEARFAFENQKPIFLIGAFGGASKVLIKQLESSRLEKFEKMTCFEDKHIKNLNNGLTDEENKILFYTHNISEMISLVLKGLRKLWTV